MLLASLIAPGLFALASPHAPLAPPALVAPVVQADDENEFEDERELIEDLLDELGELTRGRGEQDGEAIQLVGRLSTEFARSGERDRRDIVKALDRCMNLRRRPLAEDQPNNALFRAVGQALGGMGPESVRPLEKWIDHNKHEDDLALQRVLILALGNTRDEDAVDTLIDLLNEYQWVKQGAAAEALGQFTGLENKDRKEVFEELLKTFGAAEYARQDDPQSNDARQRLNTIRGPIQTSLQRLSGASVNGYANWQSWWNDNKRRNWDR